MTPAKLLTRAEILAQKDRATEIVEAFGGSVTVRALSGSERDKYEADMVRLGPDGKVLAYNVQGKRARLLLLSVVAPDGQPMFTSADILALGDLDSQEIDRVLTVAMRLSGMTEAEVEAAKEGFTPGRSDSPGSDSPAISDTGASPNASPR